MLEVLATARDVPQRKGVERPLALNALDTNFGMFGWVCVTCRVQWTAQC